MPGRFRFVVTCLVVMGCSDLERCRQAGRLLMQRGFQSRSAVEGGRTCTRLLEREFPEGLACDLLEDACTDIEQALGPNVHQWKAFIQVVGERAAWATMESGKPTQRGTL